MASLRQHWFIRGPGHAGAVALAALLMGCPELLDESAPRDDSHLSHSGGSCGEDTCSGGGGSASGGGSQDAGWGSGAGGAGGNGAGGTAGSAALAELRRCPFGEPERLEGLDFGSGSEWGASLSADGLTLFFAHEAPGNTDLYRATRADRGTTFSTPIPLTNLNTPADEGTPVVSADGLRLYFYSTRPGGPGGRDLYIATRGNLADEFESPELLANVNSAAFDHLPRLSSDELTLWFTSERAGGPGAADVWTASRASLDAPFGAPVVMSAVNGSAGDESAVLTEDGLVLIFDSTRDGDSDIFITTRASASQPFPTPTPLSAVISAVNEYNVFLTADERELFFSSNRPNGTPHHLYRALRSCD